MNFTESLVRLHVRMRSDRIEYLCWSLRATVALFVMFFAASLINLKKFEPTPKFNDVLGVNTMIAIKSADIVATRRLNDTGRKKLTTND